MHSIRRFQGALNNILVVRTSVFALMLLLVFSVWLPAQASGPVILPDNQLLDASIDSPFDGFNLIQNRDFGTGKFRFDNIPLSNLDVFDSEIRGQFHDYQFAARSYYQNDQRIEFTGQEATFGVEGVFFGNVQREIEGWQSGVWAEVYLNQPFDRNILADHPDRVSFLSNFDVDTFEISQLFLTARRDDLLFGFGKMVTPFGRAYYSQYTNSRQDGPFIRTESILWRETGLVVQYDPGIWVLTGGVTNGGDERDTNSSKALVARVGIDLGNFVLGGSVKTQDGISSEHHKTFNNHVGLDAMWQNDRFRISGEAIYDEYGFRRPGLDFEDIFWRRSVYFRQQNEAELDPITGVGYYVNLDIFFERWTVGLNYGEFYPEEIGDPLHDENNRRGLVRLVRHSKSNLDFYFVGLFENQLEGIAFAGKERGSWSILGGFEFRL